MFSLGKYKAYIIIFFVMFFFITLYHYHLCDFKTVKKMGLHVPDHTYMKKDPFSMCIGKVGPVQFAGWPISHFLLYVSLGILYPDDELLILGMGVLWEICENLMGKTVYKSIKSNKDSRQVSRRDENNLYTSEVYWQGNFMDIFFNAAGYYLGKYLHRCRHKGQ